MSEIIKDKLYLGDYFTVQRDIEYIINNKFTCLINVAAEVTYSKALLNLAKTNNILLYNFKMMDNLDYNIEKYAHDIAELLSILIKTNQKIYIHCMMGISRSATIVILYLMKYHNMTYTNAFEFVKQ